MSRRALLLVFFTIASFSMSLFAQTELVNNGTFSSGATSWNLGTYGGSSSGAVASGEYRILVTTAGTEHWHTQFTQSGLSLQQGKTYEFSFDAYKGTQNSGTQSMQVNIGMSGSPYTSYFGGQNQMVTLSTTKTTYTYTITMTLASDVNARVEFNCGKSTGNFYIDNVSLHEQVAAVPKLGALTSSVSFGTVSTGVSTTQNVTLQNLGSAVTTISSLQASSNVVSFGLSAPVTVPAGGSVALPIRFLPVTAGVFTGSVTVYSNATDNPALTLSCSGTAVDPGLSFTPASVVLTARSGEPVTQKITLVNTSSAPLTWSMSQSVSWLTVAPASGTIAAGSQAVCTFTATNSTLGTYTTSVSLTHSAGNIPSPAAISVSFSVVDGYQPQCPYIQNPETAIEFVRDLVAFRMRQRDNTNGGYFTDIDRQGNPTSANEKSMCGQSRIAYAFVRAFMLTGDEQYLEHAHHALKFLYDHGWNNGWYLVTDRAGNYVSHWGHNDWWSFQQHYALLGITAMVEATGGTMNWNDGSESDHAWLMRGINLNYTKLWDSNPATKGYFDRSNTAWTNKWNKGFHATVDGITTHGMLMSMIFDSLNHKERFVELADNVVDHLIANMSQAAAGFPEVYSANWTIDNSVPSMDIGHGFKTAWVLQRAYLLHPERTEYRTAAEALMQNLYEHGCYDSINGAPYRYVNWQTGVVTDKSKDFWMVEQGFTSGIMSYYTTESQDLRDRYLKIADQSLNFFVDHLMDPVYGESYNIVSENGATVVDPNKGGLFTAGYHSTELGYYAYLYSSLYYHQKPVDLYYYYPVQTSERSFKLTPVAINDNVLKIVAMTLDGVPYTDFNSDTRTVHLPANVGGKLKVTFGFTPAVTHTITASAGAGGAISPSGAITVNEGTSQSFSIVGAPGYRIVNVTVDGSSAGKVATYTFNNITADHSIAVTFEPIPTFKITASASTGGTISPAGETTVYENGSVNFTITPATGYRINDVTIDGVSAGSAGTYIFSAVNQNHTIAASFAALPTFTISASAGSGGTITPSGNVTAPAGASQTFTFTPQTGYAIASVTVDGSSVPVAASYSFTAVSANHTIEVAFAVKTYAITATAGAGGTISPSGSVAVAHGTSKAFTITPQNGYKIAAVTVDGANAGTASTYTFTAVTAAHSINVTFAVISPVVYQINTGTNSAASPFSADQYVSGGTMRTVTNAITMTGLTDPAPQAVYQSERYGNSTYTIPGLTPSVEYKVRLHFVELYQTASGKRVFNVAINGTTVLSNFDIFAATGAIYKAAIREFTAAANSSGQLIITFTTVTDNATIEGIEVLTTIPNDPPVIVTSAAATPAPVIATTATLSVLAGDDNGESNLVYTWATTGTVPASVAFSRNGTNAAKTTVATFTKAGAYNFTVTVKDVGNRTVASNLAVTVNQTPTALSVSPATASVSATTTQQFSASVTDQFGAALQSQVATIWSVSGGGTIATNGLFSAGSSAGSYTVSAVNGTLTATAAVTVVVLPATVYQINTGTTSTASPFTADQYGSGGTMRTVTDAISLTGVTNPAPQAVYQSERYGNSTYTIPSLTAGTSYKVRLHFAELYQTATGKRIFNVVINGTTVLSNFDIYAVTNARFKAIVREFTATANSSGQIVINFTTVTDNATIEGIEILR